MILPYNLTASITIFSGILTTFNLYPSLLSNLLNAETDDVLVTVYQFSENDIKDANIINQEKFPDEFLFGTGTVAYSVEGAYNLNGKGLSVWDIYGHLSQNDIQDHSNGDVAADSYHLYVNDVYLAKQLGGKVYRFSIAWTRILPTGMVDQVNLDGVQYYNNLINEIVTSNMTPIVIMYDNDYPYQLHLLGGWKVADSITWFTNYAELLFKLFGDRVKTWITFNKPEEMCVFGYGGIKYTVTTGVDDYLCGHNILLAHCTVYDIYYKKYRKTQKGNVGIAFNMAWYEPLKDTAEDFEAAARTMVFKNEWLLHPLVAGDYPELMKARINGLSLLQGLDKSRLPSLKGKVDFVKGKTDFIGIDYLSTLLTTSPNNVELYANNSYYEFINNPPDVDSAFVINNSEPLNMDIPENLSKLIEYLNYNYLLPPIYITGNGYADNGQLNDTERLIYIYHHIAEIMKLMKNDVDIRGYFIKSLIDGFDGLNGYKYKYGVYSVDFNDANRTRTPKFSRDGIKQIYTSKVLPPLKLLLKNKI